MFNPPQDSYVVAGKYRRRVQRTPYGAFPYILILLISFYFFPANLFAQPARQVNSYKAGGEEKITNEQIYRELKIFETKMEEIFKIIDEKFSSFNLSSDQRFVSIDQRFVDLNNRIDQRFVYLNNRIDDLFIFLWILTGIFTAITGVTISLAFWDRKTIVELSVKKSFDKIESEGTSKKLLDALRELAKEDKKIAEVLKSFNLL